LLLAAAWCWLPSLSNAADSTTLKDIRPLTQVLDGRSLSAQTFILPRGGFRPAIVPAIHETIPQRGALPLPIQEGEQAFTEEELAGIYAIAQIIQKYYVNDVDRKQLYYGALEGMAKKLDPHSVFMDPEAFQKFQEQLQGSFSGIGIGLKKKEKGQFLGILYVMPNGGAEKVGLLANDEIAKVNGEDTRSMEIEEIVSKVKGKPGTTVQLTIRRKDLKTQAVQTLDVTVTRQRVSVPNLFSKIVGNQVGYIYLNGFRGESAPGAQDDSATQLFRAIRDLKWKGANSLVIDLRNNPGGSLTVVAAMVEAFLKKGELIVSVKDRRGRTQEYRARKNGEFAGLPLTVLANGYSASASEIFAGAMQDHGLARVVGSTTYGKGSVQSIIPFDDGSALKLTTQRYYTPSGRSVSKDPKTGEGGGVTPDVAIEQSEEDEAKVMAQILRELSNAPQKGDRVPDPVLDHVLKGGS